MYIYIYIERERETDICVYSYNILLVVVLVILYMRLAPRWSRRSAACCPPTARGCSCWQTTICHIPIYIYKAICNLRSCWHIPDTTDIWQTQKLYIIYDLPYTYILYVYKAIYIYIYVFATCTCIYIYIYIYI